MYRRSFSATSTTGVAMLWRLHRRLALFNVSLLAITLVHALPHRSKLYGDVEEAPITNLLQFGLGIAAFLSDGEHFQAAEPDDYTPQSFSEYDFVIVGAGTAGATIANRLTEIKDAKVLLIEAGQNENLLMDVPLMVHFLQYSDKLNWKYETEPSDKYCMGLVNRRCKWPRGKVIGGSSVLNYMIATRCTPEDYDRWVQMGNVGWSYQDVLPYFKKLENMQIPELRKDTKFHNTEGPIPISYAPFRSPLSQAFIKAGLELGYPYVDYNGNGTIGYSYVQSTTSNGMRVSSSKAYLHPIKHRRNLFVTKESLASKVLVDGKRMRAIGVEFTKQGKRIRVYAKKEVILTSGTIGSAQLLMLSGIGHADHLRDHGIKVIKDLPVGDNLMDHVAYGGLAFLVNDTVSLNALDMANLQNPFLQDFLNARKGPFTIPGTCEGLAFINVDEPKNRSSAPNMELLFNGFAIPCSDTFGKVVGLNDDVVRTWDRLRDQHSWGILPILLKPKSRGWIRLKANDVNVKPMIVPNYMDHPDDVRIMVAGIKEAIKVSKTRAMKQFGSVLFDRPLPGCEHHKYESDDYWECLTRTVTFNIYHYSGTCKMGTHNDPTAVVNPRLQVIGVEGLRVADASIMPEIPSGHTNIPVYMIAEKLADMVKEDWGYPVEPLP